MNLSNKYQTIESHHTHKYTFLWAKCQLLFKAGLVDSVVLFTLLCFVTTELLFPVGWLIDFEKNGCFNTSVAEILLTGESSKILWRTSIQSFDILSDIDSSNFLNLFLRISYSVIPALGIMILLAAFISTSSASVGQPMKYWMTLLRLLVSLTSNIEYWFLLFKYLKINFKKITPADQMSILES